MSFPSLSQSGVIHWPSTGSYTRSPKWISRVCLSNKPPWKSIGICWLGLLSCIVRPNGVLLTCFTILPRVSKITRGLPISSVPI